MKTLRVSFICILFTTFFTWFQVDSSAITAGTPQNPQIPGFQCVRLFHSKGDIGCRSPRGGISASLFHVSKEADVDQLLLQNEKQMVILATSMFNSEILDRINDKVAGLLVYPNAGTNNISPASTSPQGKNSIDANLNPFNEADIEWNPTGRNLIERSFNYPVVEVDSFQKAEDLIKKAESNMNGDTGPVFSGEMDHYFGPEEMDSKTCLTFKDISGKRNPRCSPIGGQSVWSYRGDITSSDSSIIIAMASMDTTAFSHFFAPGANAGASGVVALLAAADALKAIPSSDFKKAVVFAAFQGESYGFVGSRRLLRDINKFGSADDACNGMAEKAKTPFASKFCLNPLTNNLDFINISPSKIQHAIAVDQVGITTESEGMFIHENPRSGQKGLAQEILKVPGAEGFTLVEDLKGLPPSSLYTFLNDKEFGNPTMSAAMITGYGKSFSNANYHSRYDNASSLNSDNIERAAKVLAESLAMLATGNSTALQVNKTLIETMISCFSSDWRCSLMEEYSKTLIDSLTSYSGLSNDLKPEIQVPPSLYAGVFANDRQTLIKEDGTSQGFSNSKWDEKRMKLRLFPNAYELFIKSFLGSINGLASRSSSENAASCSKSVDCQNDDLNMDCVFPGRCAPRTAFFHDAYSLNLSPTLKPGIFDVSESSISPMWTEPTWNTLSNFVYSDPGNTIGWVSLVLGLVISAFGVFLSFWFLRGFKKHKLF